jgi:HSP20 family molecular chaperone IbpA
MRGTRLELMHDHVRAIHRAVTGEDPPAPRPRDEHAPPLAPESVLRRFADLEALARSIEPLADRVPPFSFAPPLDVIETARELVFELGVPGVERGDVDVDLDGETLIVAGARSIAGALDGRVYVHAEMPSGPFRRTVRLAEPAVGPPRVEVEHGIVRVRLTRTTRASLPRA